MPLINYIGNRQEALAGGTGGFVRGNAPPPPALSFDYLIVGGGSTAASNGGGAGGFLAGSGSIDFNTTIDIVVGLGRTGSMLSGSFSSITGPTFGTGAFAYGANGGQSGFPTSNPAGLGTPTSNGGGGGAGQAGVDGIPGLSGRGGDGLQWLDGNYYAGGGGGAGTQFAGEGDGTIDNGKGGGGRGAPDGGSGQNGEDGKGGGAGGGMPKGGDGVVILRYLTSSLVPPYDHALSTGTAVITGSYAYLTFTGSTQLRYSF